MNKNARPLAAGRRLWLRLPRDEIETFYYRGHNFHWNRPPRPIWRATDAKTKIGRSYEWVGQRPLERVAEIRAGAYRETRS